MNIQDELHNVATARQSNWNSYPATDINVTVSCTKKLEELYARMRLERARRHHGSTADIVKRARVEREIERLAAENGS